VKLSDEELIERIRNGDEDALRTAFGLYRNYIYYLYHQSSNMYPNSDLDEFMQVGQLSIYNSIMSYRSDRNTSLKSYILQNIRYRILELRDQYHNALYFNGKATLSLDNILHDDETNYLSSLVEDKKLISCEEEANLREQLGKIYNILNPQERIVYKLRLQGYSYREIAKRLGVNIKRVDNVMQKIRKKI